MNENFSEVFCLLVDLCTLHGGKNIKDLPGCFTLTLGQAFIAMNGHKEPCVAPAPEGDIEVPPYGSVMFWNGWLIYIGNPYGGTTIIVDEDELIRRILSLDCRLTRPEEKVVTE